MNRKKEKKTAHSAPLSWRQIKVIAFGELDLHPWELDKYTMTDFALKLEGSKAKERKEWEKIRVLAYYSILPDLKNKKFEKFMPLNDEKRGNSGQELVKQVKAMMGKAEKSTWKIEDKTKTG